MTISRFDQAEEPLLPSDGKGTGRSDRFPLLLRTGPCLVQAGLGTSGGADLWTDFTVLEMHPHDSETRGIANGDWVRITSGFGEVVLRALVTNRLAAGTVYTTVPSSAATYAHDQVATVPAWIMASTESPVWVEVRRTSGSEESDTLPQRIRKALRVIRAGDLSDSDP